MLSEYPFWIPDYNRASNYKVQYPLTEVIYEYPNATWLTGRPKFSKVVEQSVKRTLARAYPCLPVFVVYSIPNRDLGHYSKGGQNSREEYLEFCRKIAAGIGNSSPILIFEPDALPHVCNMDAETAADRIDLIKEALNVLKTSKARIYVDVGHSNWLSPVGASDLLTYIEIEKYDGFSINTSNFRGTKESTDWGDKVCSMFNSDITYVVDTSRNGNGPLDNEWCNPPGRALGHPPTVTTSSKNCDAYLWIKVPGESDGKCNGAPKAGQFYPKYAEELVKNSELNK